jgi:cytochrome c553
MEVRGVDQGSNQYKVAPYNRSSRGLTIHGGLLQRNRLTMINKLALLLALVLPCATTLAQDVAAGSRKVAQCIGCHGIPGYQSSFPQVHRVPMIAGQSAAYIVSALTAYKKGDRKHPTMRGVAGPLGDKDIADLAAYYEQLGQGGVVLSDVALRQPPAEVTALITKGACVSCHGANFNKPIANYPRLAGQHPDYLAVALKSYQTQGNPQIGRNNPVMGGVARQFTPAELQVLAAWLGSLPGTLKTVPQSKFR